MDESSLKPNSFKSKNELANRKDDVVDSPVKIVNTKERSVFRRLGDILINQNEESITDYVINQVIVPSVKNMWADALISVIEFIFGTRRPRSSNGSKTNYTVFSNSSNKPVQSSLQEPERYSVATSRQDFKEVIFEERWQAEDAIDKMTTAIMEYGTVSVADYYDIVGIPSNFTDNKYGWTNLANAHIERVGGGYLLKLPPTVKLD